MFKRLKNIVRRWMPSSKSRFLADVYPDFAIGRYSYGKLSIVKWENDTQLSIGAFCSFAAGSKVLLGGEHNVDWVSTFPFTDFLSSEWSGAGHPKSKGDIIIGNDVWVGTDAVILSGVNIGCGAVVAARATVTSDVPPYAIVGGTPARVIAYRFSEEQVSKMLAIKWWDWPLERIQGNIALLMSDDIDNFINCHHTTPLDGLHL